AVLLLLLAICASSQETPTERQAASDILRRIAELQKTVDVQGWVQRLTGANAERDRVVARAQQLMQTELLAMGDDITRHPEIGFKETRSVQVLTDYLRKHDFEITMPVAGLDTAFVGRWKGNNGGPNLGVILEYDALRGTLRAF